ncbi:dihydrofolate reductase family protein [Streptomyces sp. CA-111067]|uniref:dihydrofolate reductase family protein n=1 Tax=Streptomyces sp. CA-111067 TaxID=3240046 RepID=UPI003D953C88
MRKILLSMMVSLDGYIEDRQQRLDWHLVDNELHQHFNDELKQMGAFLDGRRTYELMAGFWPTADADPKAEQPVAEFARIWREMPKIVYSRTLDRADWNTTVVREVVVEDVMALKAQEGGDLALGGADLAATFVRHDLVDVYQVYVNPFVLGGGTRMFPQLDTRIGLELTDTRRFDNGVVLLRYERVGAAGAAGA